MSQMLSSVSHASAASMPQQGGDSAPNIAKFKSALSHGGAGRGGAPVRLSTPPESGHNRSGRSVDQAGAGAISASGSRQADPEIELAQHILQQIFPPGLKTDSPQYQVHVLVLATGLKMLKNMVAQQGAMQSPSSSTQQRLPGPAQQSAGAANMSPGNSTSRSPTGFDRPATPEQGAHGYAPASDGQAGQVNPAGSSFGQNLGSAQGRAAPSQTEAMTSAQPPQSAMHEAPAGKANWDAPAPEGNDAGAAPEAGPEAGQTDSASSPPQATAPGAETVTDETASESAEPQGDPDTASGAGDQTGSPSPTTAIESRPEAGAPTGAGPSGNVADVRPRLIGIYGQATSLVLGGTPQFSGSGQLLSPEHRPLLQIANFVFARSTGPQGASRATDELKIGTLKNLLAQDIPYEDETKGSFSMRDLGSTPSGATEAE